jgi:DNA-binding transcriptional regulator YiaG
MADVADCLTALRHKAEQVEGLVTPPRSARKYPPTDPDASGVECRWSWYQRLEDAMLDLSNSLPEGTSDYDARKLFEFLIALRRAITADSKATDERGKVELATMKMRDAVSRIGRELEHNILEDPQAAAKSVFTTLRNSGVSELARLLGVSTKTIKTWEAGGPVTRKTKRVVIVAQLLTDLRYSMTSVGLIMWFDAPRRQLGGRTPLDLLNENESSAQEMLISLARGARGQLAS